MAARPRISQLGASFGLCALLTAAAAAARARCRSCWSVTIAPPRSPCFDAESGGRLNRSLRRHDGASLCGIRETRPRERLLKPEQIRTCERFRCDADGRSRHRRRCGIMQVVVEAGADANSPNREGQTALMAVARTGHVDAAAALLDAGADQRAEQWGGQTALMWAASQQQPEMVTSGRARRGVDARGSREIGSAR